MQMPNSSQKQLGMCPCDRVRDRTLTHSPQSSVRHVFASSRTCLCVFSEGFASDTVERERP